MAKEPRDPRYDHLRRDLAATDRLVTPTLMVQGASDFFDGPSTSEGLEDWFGGSYRQVVLDGVGHFPHRAAPETVAELVHDHFVNHH